MFCHILECCALIRAQHSSKTIWIEKTHIHLYQISYVTQQISEARFIHIARAAEDTIASLYSVRKQYPNQWSNELASVELSVDRWIKGISISSSYAHLPIHLFVSYESLIRNPCYVLQHLCQFIGIGFTVNMLSGYASTAQQVSLKREPWKAGVATPIQNANSTKFYSLFTSNQQAYILARTASVDI